MIHNNQFFRLSMQVLLKLLNKNKCLKVFTLHGVTSQGFNRHEINERELTLFIEFMLKEKNAFYNIQQISSVNDYEKSVFLTFDDGSKSSYDYAKRILHQFGITATFFIPSSIFEEKDRNKFEEIYSTNMVNEEQTLELFSLGHEIGGHSHVHKPLASLSELEVKEDLHKCKNILEEIIGNQVTSFAYPYGMSNSFSDLTDKLIQEVGFKYICTQTQSIFKGVINYNRIPRIGIDGRDNLSILKSKFFGKSYLINKFINESN